MNWYTAGYTPDWQDNSAYEEYYAKLAGSYQPAGKIKPDQPKTSPEIGAEEMGAREGKNQKIHR